MSIDPNKAFGMKATNKSYTLEFRKEQSGITSINAVDAQTSKLSARQRLSIAWAILTGKKTIGELVFPLNLRSSDFYHMSYIYRPNVETKEEKPKGRPKAEKVSADASTAAPAKKRAPRAKKTTAEK